MKGKKGKKPILELGRERVILLDGAMGTMLFSSGLPYDKPPELWNLSHPEIILKIHQRYIRAGADIIQTNTFGASSLKLKKSGNEKKVGKINLSAVKIAKEACPVDKYVAGNIGPSGEFFEPLGKAKFRELKKVFSRQAELLLGGGVDLFSIETMFDLREALSAVEGVREVSSLPLFICMTFEKKPKGYFTLMGDKVSFSLKKLEEAGADVVGANCTLGSAEMIGLIPVMKKSTNLPLIVQPNAGKPVIRKGKTVYLQKPDSFAKDIVQMIKSGVSFVGGCCGTTPEFIRKIKEGLKNCEKRKC
ncbi:MAG TPA: homocysteine S-methyltransferase family protein [candidate division Zixibacteria bacterium]